MAKSHNAIDSYIDRHFISNQYGIWCPNCQESIDSFWPESCDHCGYPKKDYDRFDDDDHDYHEYHALSHPNAGGEDNA